MAKRDVLLKISELALGAEQRQYQPWRFEIVSDDHIAIHGSDTRDWCVIRFRRSCTSHMARRITQTLRIAASGFSLRACNGRYGRTQPAQRYLYDVILGANARNAMRISCSRSSEQRVVQRRPMSTRKQ